MDIKILEISEGNFSVLVPFLGQKKANRVLDHVETYLNILGYDNGLQSSWDEERIKDSWFTVFYFKFPTPGFEPKKAIEFALEQVIKEEK